MRINICGLIPMYLLVLVVFLLECQSCAQIGPLASSCQNSELDPTLQPTAEWALAPKYKRHLQTAFSINKIFFNNLPMAINYISFKSFLTKLIYLLPIFKFYKSKLGRACLSSQDKFRKLWQGYTKNIVYKEVYSNLLKVNFFKL